MTNKCCDARLLFDDSKCKTFGNSKHHHWIIIKSCQNYSYFLIIKKNKKNKYMEKYHAVGTKLNSDIDIIENQNRRP